MNVSQFPQSLKLGFLLPLLVLAAVSARPMAAQTGGQGAISGTVTDTTGAVVSGATVIATNNATSIEVKQPTTSGGVYTIEPLTPGTYTVTVTGQSSNGITAITQNTTMVLTVQ